VQRIRRLAGNVAAGVEAEPHHQRRESASASLGRTGACVKLYSYFRSSAAYRVRIALNIKALAYETVPVHLLKDGGQHKTPSYRALNPQMRVPTLALPSGDILIQSVAIIEYLEEAYPNPPLLPPDKIDRAHVRAVAQVIACDIHPLNNTAAINYLKTTLEHDQAAIDAWYSSWVIAGFEAIEAMIDPAPYAFGPAVTLADLCIVPQVFNARRFKIPLDAFPKIVAADAACAKLAAFEQARPDNQPDAE
jgi:maleylacetoacetate isomerase